MAGERAAAPASTPCDWATLAEEPAIWDVAATSLDSWAATFSSWAP